MKEGDKVKVHYTGSLNDDTIFDSSEGREPLEFTIGQKQVIPGFEEGIKSMELNQEKIIKIKPQDAYGEANAQLIVNVPRDKFPPKIDVGGKLILKGPQGQQIHAVVKKVEKDNVLIDLNHQLEEKELTFKVKVVGVN